MTEERGRVEGKGRQSSDAGSRGEMTEDRQRREEAEKAVGKQDEGSTKGRIGL